MATPDALASIWVFGEPVDERVTAMGSCPTVEHLATLLDDQPPSERSSVLEGHLNNCTHCQKTLLSLAVDTTELQRQHKLFHPDASDAEAPTDLLSGLKRTVLIASQGNTNPEPAPVIPGYEILGELGRGGMAVVYRARQVGLNRHVALKMILAGRHAAPELRARFRREAEAVARLQHPNIVQIHEIGEQDGLPYFSMELVEGGSLKEQLRRTPNTPGHLAAGLVATLARAIHAAHLAGVVHRDLKPANILLATDIAPSPAGQFSFCQPKITDFGLALHRDTNDGWTRTGDVLGTPQYMAPEQAQGKRGEIGPATDVHALGIILYEMLVGRTPFAGEDDMSTLIQASFEEPMPLRRLRSSVPRDLETICLKCLNKLPTQRYGSALELAEDLDRFQAGKPILARPTTPRERLVKWVRRYPTIAALILVLQLVTIAGFAGVTLAMIDARSARDEEARQRGKAEDAGTRALEALDRSERSVYFGTIAQARSQWLLNNVPAAARLLDHCLVERRGWEWHYLRGLNHGDLVTISEKGDPWVTSVAYSPDGRWIASVGGDPFVSPEVGYIQAHDATTGKLRWRNGGQSHLLRCLAYSPDGRLIAAGSANWWGNPGGRVQILNAATGETVCDLKARFLDGILGLAFSPDSRRLVTAGPKSPVTVWDTGSGEEVYRAGMVSVYFVAFTSDGQLLAYEGPNGLELHDAANGKLVSKFPQITGTAALSPDGSQLATVVGNQVSLWAMSHEGGRVDIRLTKAFDGHEGGVSAVTFRPDGQAVATAGLDGTVRLRELGGATEPTVYRGHLGRVSSLAFHPSGRSLASGGKQPGEIKIWDITRKPECVDAITFSPERRDVALIGFNKDDRELLVLSVGGILRSWECLTGAISEREFPCSNAWLVPATPAAFSDDGKLLATISDSNLVRVLETASGREISVFRGHTVRIRFVACDRECSRVVTLADGTKDKRPVRELKVWDVRTGRIIHEETAFDQHGIGVALSPDGTELLNAYRMMERDAEGRIRVAKEGASLTLSSLDTPGVSKQLSMPGSGLSAIVFSPRGRYIAAADSAGVVRVWDRDGKHVHENPLTGPDGLAALAFNPDETRLAGVNRERVQVWDVASGQDTLFLRGAGPRPNDNSFNPRVAWSHHGTRLAASNWNRTVTVWDAADSSAVAGKAILATQAARRSFNWHQQWAEGLGGTVFSTNFHRDRMLAISDLTPMQRRQRGEFLARSGRWDEARADYSILFTSDKLEMPRLCEEYAALLIKCGDDAAYRALRSRVMLRVANQRDVLDAMSCIHLGGLLPTSQAEGKQLLGIAQQYHDANPRSPLPLECLGLAQFRAGELEQAKQSLLKALKQHGEDPGGNFTRVVLALVYLRLGDPAAAVPLLKRVDEWLAEQAKATTPGAMLAQERLDWSATLEIELLRKEAQLIGASPNR